MPSSGSSFRPASFLVGGSQLSGMLPTMHTTLALCWPAGCLLRSEWQLGRTASLITFLSTCQASLLPFASFVNFRRLRVRRSPASLVGHASRACPSRLTRGTDTIQSGVRASLQVLVVISMFKQDRWWPFGGLEGATFSMMQSGHIAKTMVHTCLPVTLK